MQRSKKAQVKVFRGSNYMSVNSTSEVRNSTYRLLHIFLILCVSETTPDDRNPTIRLIEKQLRKKSKHVPDNELQIENLHVSNEIYQILHKLLIFWPLDRATQDHNPINKFEWDANENFWKPKYNLRKIV